MFQAKRRLRSIVEVRIAFRFIGGLAFRCDCRLGGSMSPRVIRRLTMIPRWKRVALIAAFWGFATAARAQSGLDGPSAVSEPMPIAQSAIGYPAPPAMPGGPAAGGTRHSLRSVADAAQSSRGRRTKPVHSVDRRRGCLLPQASIFQQPRIPRHQYGKPCLRRSPGFQLRVLGLTQGLACLHEPGRLRAASAVVAIRPVGPGHERVKHRILGGDDQQSPNLGARIDLTGGLPPGGRDRSAA